MNDNDITKLHNDVTHILEHPYDDRAFGSYTDAYLQLMLDEVWGGEDGNKYLYIGEDEPGHVQKQFEQLLTEAGIAFYSTYRVTDAVVHKQRFVFAEVWDDGLDFLKTRPIQQFNRIFANSKNARARDKQQLFIKLLLNDGDVI